ncbi:hypothetical protein [Aminobacter aminovorans]|uniref:Uncharacterized protein n=1 Tax=Aminobacter aminovorans TaxID=83263 RepID=A0AAC8YLL4_AMIAI|nr:hypothetical protein [Aminobacter aminovorans]AMS40159.1 hypothetical protein AA2016_1224 [Aminobacter aminovorans]MBB3709886.1 hypothetical protein [Aminobacter aminovorans]
MNEFNRMTIVAAAEVAADFNSHSDMEVLEVQWGIDGRFGASSKSARVASWAKLACDEELTVMTENGRVSLERALVETAITAPEARQGSVSWNRLVAGLRFDGFEIVETEISVTSRFSWGGEATKKILTLVRMLPKDIPGLDFREAESEVVTLLDRSGFTVARGHLKQAVSAFQRGEWSSANGELRNFYESYLNEIAVALGYVGGDDSKAKRDFLGASVQPPFLLVDYNEWNANTQKPQYIQGLMSRMHPHGGHPGLSEEEDATFRLQITLITARLFLRRFCQRKAA